MTVISITSAGDTGWLRSRNFDLTFIVGVAGLALAAGAVASNLPEHLKLLMVINGWLLGRHHVFATYSRLFFERRSFHDNRVLILAVPLIILACNITLVASIGVWLLMTIYFHWQWFHYTRQSWGISRAYQRKAGNLSDLERRIGDAAFYLVPVWGILNRSYQQPVRYLAVEFKTFPVPIEVVNIAAAAAVLAVAAWLVLRVVAIVQGRVALGYTLFMLSHFAVFYVAYVFISDITAGWMTATVWHNAQYLLFVWMHNNNQYGGGGRPQAKTMSYICQTKNAWIYVLFCLALSTVFYLALDGVVKSQSIVAVLPLLLIMNNTINFHHYITDSVIWRQSYLRRFAAPRSGNTKGTGKSGNRTMAL